MMQSPEEYFQGREFVLEEGERSGGLTPAEKAFLEKYLGLGNPGAVERPRSAAETVRPQPVPSAVGPDHAAPSDPAVGVASPPAVQPAETPRPEPPQEGMADAEGRSLEEDLRDVPEVQMVSFFLENQEFVVPIHVVQEVVRAIPPTKLPEAPPFLAGIINLRGRVTPLVRLRTLLGVGGDDSTDRFIVVVRRRGLQFGLQIQRVAAMYRVPRGAIEWGMEAQLGINGEYVSALMKSGDGERLVGVISVDRILDTMLRR